MFNDNKLFDAIHITLTRESDSRGRARILTGELKVMSRISFDDEFEDPLPQEITNAAENEIKYAITSELGKLVLSYLRNNTHPYRYQFSDEQSAKICAVPWSQPPSEIFIMTSPIGEVYLLQEREFIQKCQLL